MNFKNYSVSDFESAWLKYNRETAGGSDWLASEWVIGAGLEWSLGRPNELWQAILGLTRQELTVEETEMLGVGPLENLLNEGFEEFVNTVFNEAKQSDLLADALNCIYVPEQFEEDFEQRLALLNSNVS
jgi:hypothetical protein